MLLENYRFWQGEDMLIRGYPRPNPPEWFSYYIEVRVTRNAADGAPSATITRQERPFAPMVTSAQLPAQSPLLRQQSSVRSTVKRLVSDDSDASLSAGEAKGADAPQPRPELERQASTSSTQSVQSVGLQSKALRLKLLTDKSFHPAAAEYALDICQKQDGRWRWAPSDAASRRLVSRRRHDAELRTL